MLYNDDHHKTIASSFSNTHARCAVGGSRASLCGPAAERAYVVSVGRANADSSSFSWLE